MTEHDDARPARPLITPPPGLVPDAAPTPGAGAVVRPAGGPLIDLPPGLADSGTVRMPAARRPTVVAPPAGPAPATPAAPATAPRFFPAVPGMPPVPPTSPAPPALEPAPGSPAPGLAPAPAPAPTPVDSPAPTPEPPVASPDPGALAIELPDGRRLAVTGRMLLGRDPAELDGWRGAELVRLIDPERSVSKTHAAIEPDQGALLVHDLASTNGTERATPLGQVLPVSPGHPLRVEVGDALHLGSFRIRLLDGP